MVSHEDVRQYQKRLQIHRANLAHHLDQKAMLASAYLPPAVTFGINEARQEIARIKQILRGWSVAVEDHPDDDEPGSAPVPFTASDQAAQVSGNAGPDHVSLRQFLVEHFALDELRDICFELGIDYENVPGNQKSSVARELIAYLQRRGRYAELVALVRRMRPGML